MVVLRPEPPAAIRWECSTCHDEGVISNWCDSPDDLRRRTLTLACPLTEIAITDAVASVLRDLRFLDTDSERVVFAMRGDGERGRGHAVKRWRLTRSRWRSLGFPHRSPPHSDEQL